MANHCTNRQRTSDDLNKAIAQVGLSGFDSRLVLPLLSLGGYGLAVDD